MPKRRPDDAIDKIGLVSLSDRVQERMDPQRAALIHAECERRGCDTILYALHSWPDQAPRTHNRLFGTTQRLHTLILETSRSARHPPVVELWVRNRTRPIRYEQPVPPRAIPSQQIRLLLDLESRWFQHGLTLIPGNVGVLVGMDRSNRIRDRAEALVQFNSMAVCAVLNPSHERLQRHEDPRKLAYLSRKGRPIISVWSTGKPTDRPPWRVYYDGSDYTDTIEEIPRLFNDRPDIRVGVLAVNLLWTY